MSLYYQLVNKFDTDVYQDYWHIIWEDLQIEDDELVAEYVTKFSKILKGVDYNRNYIQKMKVRKFINSLTNRLAELIQI